MITRHDQFDVWQVAMDLVVESYRATNSFPKHETYGLASQLQRAAVSVPANFAEGFGRHHSKEFLHFLSISHGSLMELETHLHIAGRLQYLDEAKLAGLLSLTDRVGRMLNKLQASIRAKGYSVRELGLEYDAEGTSDEASSGVSDARHGGHQVTVAEYEARGTRHEARLDEHHV